MKKYYVLAVLFFVIHIALFASATVVGKFSQKLSFDKDVKTILQKNCLECHVGSTDYSTAKKNQAAIYYRVVVEKDMPPVYASSKLTDAERELIGSWIMQGVKP